MKNFEIFYLFLKRNRIDLRDIRGRRMRFFDEKFVSKIVVKEKIKNEKYFFLKMKIKKKTRKNEKDTRQRPASNKSGQK